MEGELRSGRRVKEWKGGIKSVKVKRGVERRVKALLHCAIFSVTCLAMVETVAL